MTLSLNDVLSAPTDPDLLNQHLTTLGLIPPPAPPAGAVPPATVGALSPVSVPQPKPSVAPMIKPNNTIPGGSAFDNYLAGNSLNAPKIPNPSEHDPTAPEIGVGAPTATPEALGGVAVKPMTPPVLSHSDKMALPMTSVGAPVGSAAETRNELERLQEQKDNPWGSPENHPGLLGKIGHVAAKVGNVAGDILAPGITEAIPGTDLNRAAQTRQLKTELAQRSAAEGQAENLRSEEAARNVNTEEGKARLNKLENEQNLEKDADGNVTGWKDAEGKLHSIDEEGTPQSIKDIADANQARPHFEKSANGDIVQITPGKNGAAATSNVVYKGTPNMKTEIRPIVGADGHAHDQIIDVTPGSATFGQSLKDLGRSKEDKQVSAASELAKMKGDEELVLGYDKDNRAHLMSRADAKEAGLQHISKAEPSALDKASTHHVVLNTLQTQLNNVVASSKALNQGLVQRGIIAQALSHASNTTIDNAVRATVLAGATEQTKDYVQSVLALREAGLALPKEITGGSRVSEIQASALWATQPGATSLDQKYAIKQAKKFQSDIDRLRQRAPEVRGIDTVEPDQALTGHGAKSGGGGAWKAPEGAPAAPQQDGKVLKDGKGNVVARSQGGQWVHP